MRLSIALTFVVAAACIHCGAEVVVEPGGLDGGSVADGKSSFDVDSSGWIFCDDDAALDPGYCPPDFHCDISHGQQYAWNVCCPDGDDAAPYGCDAVSH